MVEPTEAPIHWRRTPGTLWRRVFDVVLLLPPGNDEPISVTAPGALVWDLLGDPVGIDALTTAVAENYDVDPVRARADVEALIDQLVDVGAVHDSSQPVPDPEASDPGARRD